MDELDSLTGQNNPLSVTIRETKITVSEVTMGNLQAFTRACAPFLREFDKGGTMYTGPDDNGEPTIMEDFALLKVFSEHAPAFIAAAALVTNAPVAFLQRMRPDEFFKVAVLIMKVNGDFFVQRLAPQLMRFAEAMALVGTALSSNSSQPGTATQTSEITR